MAFAYLIVTGLAACAEWHSATRNVRARVVRSAYMVSRNEHEPSALPNLKRVGEFIALASPKHQRTIVSICQSLHQMLTDRPTVRNRIELLYVTSRTKSAYSTWMKMQRLGCPIEEILDLAAMRIVLSYKCTPPDPTDACKVHTQRGSASSRSPSEPETRDSKRNQEEHTLCKDVLEMVHRCGHQLPLAMKDYISNPKPNGYRSLHTTIVVDAQPIEVQIRTLAMHFNAQHGSASHLLYKQAQYRHAITPQYGHGDVPRQHEPIDGRTVCVLVDGGTPNSRFIRH